METTLKEYISKYPDLPAFMACGSQTMMLFSTAEGEILWANEAFLQWIGYTLEEFTRKNNPVTWQDISVRDESLEADMISSRKLQEGKLAHYLIRKFYVPKHGSPQFVELFVRRYPPNMAENMAISVVEVNVLYNGHARMAQAYETMAAEMKLTLDVLSASNQGILDRMDNQLATGLNGVVAWLAKRPAIGIPIAALLVLLLFGERAIEVIRSFMSLGGGAG